MFAQSIAEYGGASSLASTVQSIAYSAGEILGGISPTTWVIVAIVVIGLAIWTRR